MEPMKELISIQSKLKTPKGQFNRFGKYKYRSCEDILEALKPILHEAGCLVTLSDEILNIGERYYVRATATIINGSGEAFSVHALAREPQTKKGMDASQITGTSSSYARKYALNGLFAIDDTKDADTNESRMESDEIEKKAEKFDATKYPPLVELLKGSAYIKPMEALVKYYRKEGDERKWVSNWSKDRTDKFIYMITSGELVIEDLQL